MENLSRLDQIDFRVRGGFVVLGVVLLVSSGLIGFTGLTDTYKHDIEQVSPDSDSLQTGEPVLSSNDLSVEEQAIVLETVAAGNPTWTDDPIGLRFRYPDGPGTKTYLVDLDDSLYMLETSHVERPVTMFAHSLRVSFFVAGPLLLLTGAVPVLGAALHPGISFSHPFDTLLGTWFPAWALMVSAPAVVFGLVLPITLETIGSVPLNLFVTPFLLATGLCTAVTYGLLRTVEVPDKPFLVSAVNIPILWAVLVAFAVSPTNGATSATLTLFLGLASLPVFIGQVLGWYTLQWIEFRRSEYPNEPEYWRI